MVRAKTVTTGLVGKLWVVFQRQVQLKFGRNTLTIVIVKQEVVGIYLMSTSYQWDVSISDCKRDEFGMTPHVERKIFSTKIISRNSSRYPDFETGLEN